VILFGVSSPAEGVKCLFVGHLYLENCEKITLLVQFLSLSSYMYMYVHCFLVKEDKTFFCRQNIFEIKHLLKAEMVVF
jgi:hypothetical protein